VLVGTQTDCHAVRRELERLLREQFALEHTTLQVEHEGEELISIEPLDSAADPQSALDAS
jgi:cobalt-zinc-cadmium efflux system protein